MKKIIFLILVIIIALGVFALYKKPGNDSLISPRLVDFINFGSKDISGNYFRTIKAVIVSLPTHPDKKENMDNIRSMIEKALEDDIDLKLIVFGEATLGTYNGGDKYTRGIAESIPGPLTKLLTEYTTKFNIHISAGLIEAKEGKLFNSLVVVDPDGKITIHRKMLLHQIDEANGITQAEPNSQVVTIDGFKFGLSICADANDKWLYEQYKKENIDGLIYSITSEVPWLSKWLYYWPYGKMYNAWILAANRSGTEGEEKYDGTIFAAHPNGYMEYADNPSNYKLVVKIGK
jgi:predicted amidohydrolase